MPALQFRLLTCIAFAMCGELSSHAQLFLVTEPPSTNSSASKTLNIAWNPSPGSNVAGYYVCWGIASGACTNRLNAGNSMSATIGGIDTSLKYYFTTVSYDVLGQESAASNEIEYSPRPELVPNPGITFSGRTGEGISLQLNFTGLAGGSYYVQGSTDLLNWNTIWTTNCQGDSLIVCQLTNWISSPSGFFRVIKQ